MLFITYFPQIVCIDYSLYAWKTINNLKKKVVLMLQNIFDIITHTLSVGN